MWILDISKWQKRSSLPVWLISPSPSTSNMGTIEVEWGSWRWVPWVCVKHFHVYSLLLKANYSYAFDYWCLYVLHSVASCSSNEYCYLFCWLGHINLMGWTPVRYRTCNLWPSFKLCLSNLVGLFSGSCYNRQEKWYFWKHFRLPNLLWTSNMEWWFKFINVSYS